MLITFMLIKQEKFSYRINKKASRIARKLCYDRVECGYPFLKFPLSTSFKNLITPGK
jgi:hypothetical protein